jgi:hypothetical protein
MNIVWLSGSEVIVLLFVVCLSCSCWGFSQRVQVIYTFIYLSTRVAIPGLHLKGLTISTLDVNKPFCPTIDLYSCRRRQSGARVDVIRRRLRCGYLSNYPIDILGIWRSCATSFDRSVYGEGDGDDHKWVPLVISIDSDHPPLHPGDRDDHLLIRSKVGETIRDLAFRTGKVTHRPSQSNGNMIKSRWITDFPRSIAHFTWLDFWLHSMSIIT